MARSPLCNSQDHVYKDLGEHEDSFRLLQLQPGTKQDPISCILSLSRISCARGKYKALSYVWGPPGPTTTIEVNSVPIEVRQNLYDFLITWRDPYYQIYFWIDAVCIRQDSIKEKNHQVQAMGQIYESASEVICWLGIADETSDWLFDFIGSRGQDRNINKWDIEHFRYSSNWGSPYRYEQLKAAWKNLMLRPYWKRMWTVQELVLAQSLTLSCGTRKICWMKVASFLKTQGLWDLLGVQCAIASQPLRELIFAKEGSHHTFEDLFRLFSSRECTVTQDKIYGLLGMLSRDASKPPRLKVDYQRSMTDLVHEVMSCFQISNPLDFLQMIVKQFHLESEVGRSKRKIDIWLSESQLDTNELEPMESLTIERQLQTRREAGPSEPTRRTRAMPSVVLNRFTVTDTDHAYRLVLRGDLEMQLIVRPDTTTPNTEERFTGTQMIRGRIIALRGWCLQVHPYKGNPALGILERLAYRVEIMSKSDYGQLRVRATIATILDFTENICDRVVMNTKGHLPLGPMGLERSIWSIEREEL